MSAIIGLGSLIIFVWGVIDTNNFLVSVAVYFIGWTILYELRNED